MINMALSSPNVEDKYTRTKIPLLYECTQTYCTVSGPLSTWYFILIVMLDKFRVNSKQKQFFR